MDHSTAFQLLLKKMRNIETTVESSQPRRDKENGSYGTTYRGISWKTSQATEANGKVPDVVSLRTHERIRTY